MRASPARTARLAGAGERPEHRHAVTVTRERSRGRRLFVAKAHRMICEHALRQPRVEVARPFLDAIDNRSLGRQQVSSREALLVSESAEWDH